jgi:dephospho-CoA kinase
MARTVVICGPTGSGKSTLRRLLAERGAVALDADAVAREVVEPGSPVLARLAERFGSDIVDAEGRLRRDELARRAFATPQATEELGRITHPAVRARLLELLGEAADAPVVVVEVPLWRPEDAFVPADLVVWVGASEHRAADRVVQEGRMSAEELRRRRARFDYEAQRRAADLVVVNDGAPTELEHAAAEIWRRVTGAADVRR